MAGGRKQAAPIFYGDQEGMKAVSEITAKKKWKIINEIILVGFLLVASQYACWEHNSLAAIGWMAAFCARTSHWLEVLLRELKEMIGE